MISNQAIGDLEPYLQKPNQALYLPDKDTVGLGSRVGKVEAKTKLSLLSQQLKNLQWELYAENNRSVLVIFQSMDAGGKDSTIRKVFGDLNPQGVHVSSFKPPTTEEQQHDFLWRVNRRLPGNGEIVLFNRSHYEDVLVPFVHGQIDEDQWQGRIESIKNFEQHLAANGTVILKFFLHLSKAEQLKRFRERMETPAKRWKITREDYTARYLWGAYQKVYERVIEKTSTDHAPWFVVPADKAWWRNLVVAGITLERLLEMNIKEPEPLLSMDEIEQLFADEVAMSRKV